MNILHLDMWTAWCQTNHNWNDWTVNKNPPVFGDAFMGWQSSRAKREAFARENTVKMEIQWKWKNWQFEKYLLFWLSGAVLNGYRDLSTFSKCDTDHDFDPSLPRAWHSFSKDNQLLFISSGESLVKISCLIFKKSDVLYVQRIQVFVFA